MRFRGLLREIGVCHGGNENSLKGFRQRIGVRNVFGTLILSALEGMKCNRAGGRISEGQWIITVQRWRGGQGSLQ